MKIWPFKKKRKSGKSARSKLKQVYFYPKDYLALKAWSKQEKTTIAKLIHDILMIYLGYKQGEATREIKRLEIERNILAIDCKEKREELELYQTVFGQIHPQASRKTSDKSQ